MTECPCKECANRKSGCHSACEQYKGWRAEYDEQKQKIKDAREIDKIFAEHKDRLYRYAKKKKF